MKRNFEKNIHILNQLMGYCKKAGAVEIDSKIILNEENTSITVTALIKNITERSIQNLRRQLEIPRQPEVEQNYWNIGLSGNLGDEMGLIGMMIDRYDINCSEHLLEITVERQNTVTS